MEIRKIDRLTERGELKKGQKIILLRDFYDAADVTVQRRPIHRKGDVGIIDGFGEIYGHEIVTVEICHHGQGTFEVIPLRPSDIQMAPNELSLTRPDQAGADPEDPLAGLDDEKPVVLLDLRAGLLPVRLAVHASGAMERHPGPQGGLRGDGDLLPAAC